MPMSAKILLPAALLLVGCAAAKPKAEAKPEAKPEAAAPASPQGRYLVRKGDNLWSIASRATVMGDPFLWPLLFKSNRDQIQDPDIIEPSQDLSFKREYSREEVDRAVKAAQATPTYVPHKQPRKVLPMEY